MKHCDSCNIDINTKSKICPLCNNKLNGDCTSVFPSLNMKNKEILLRIILIMSILVIALDMYIDYMNNNKISYSIFIFIGVAIFYILLKYLLQSVYKNPLVVFYIFLIVLDVGIYVSLYFSKVLFIRNIVPIIVLINVILSIFIAISFKDKDIRKYMNIMIMDILFTMCSIGLIILNKVGNTLLLSTSIIIPILIVLFLLIYNINNIKEELVKMFYI